MNLASAIPKTSLAATKFKMGHVTVTTLPLSVICPPYDGT